ncbi:HAD-like domain-containing protein [Choanephora cucurbitarum]|nr:HAD-like domain-containing protein [Choanephora cucurbitarum]
MSCLHEMIFEGLCAICGQTVDTGSKDHINMTHNTTGITVSLVEAERLEKQDRERLLKEKKLSLIVDLDQTVLHATWEPNIANWVDEQKTKNPVKDLRTFSLDGSMNKYTIKLRPGLDAFLKEMSKYYEMHVYTMGTRSYANAVAKEIDPDGSLFQDRILTRDENKDKSTTKKYLERLFPSDQSKVVILDDRADVWDYSPHLIQVKPYEFFYGIGDINAPTNSPVIIEDTVNKSPPKQDSTQLEQDHRPNYIPDPNDADDILTVIQKILINIHTQYYQHYEQTNNTATILSQLKSAILKDCHIVFSGVIPLQTKPQDSSIWRMATSFGARCFEDLTGKATHLIAASPGTNKFNTAIRYQHIKIVYPTWLTNSIWHWKKEDETKYLVPHNKREGSNTSEVENPEEAQLDFDDGLGFEWEDDEVDAILMESEDDKSSLKQEQTEEDDEEEEEDEDIEDWLGAELSGSEEGDDVAYGEEHEDEDEDKEEDEDDDKEEEKEDDEDLRSQKRIKRVY